MQIGVSKIFQGRVLGMDHMPKIEEQQPIDVNQMIQKPDFINTNQDTFDNKIMGGVKYRSFINGKLPEIPGINNYTERVKLLTKKGANTMEQDVNFIDKSKMLQHAQGSFGTASNKVNMMLSGSSTSALKKSQMLFSGHSDNSLNKVNMMLGNSKNSSKNNNDKSLMLYNLSKTKSNFKNINVQQMLGSNIQNKSGNAVNKMLHSSFKMPTFDSKKAFSFKETTGIGTRAFSGIRFNQNMFSKNITFGNSNKRTNILELKNNALLKNSRMIRPVSQRPTLKTLNPRYSKNYNFQFNTEKLAWARMGQQKELPMFGDFDGDKVLNAFDCNPRNRFKQDEFKDILNEENEEAYQEVVDEMAKEEEYNQNYTDPMYNYSFENQPYSQENMNYASYYEQPTENQTRTAFSVNEEMRRAQEEYNKLDAKEKKGKVGAGWISYMKNLSGMFNAEQKHEFEKQKFEDEKLRKKNEELYKYGLGMATLDSQESRQMNELNAAATAREKTFDFETKKREDALKIEREKLAASGKDRAKALALEKKKMALSGFLDIQRIQDANKLNKAKLDMEKQKLEYEKGKNDRALWEARLKSGQNMLGSLIGGANNAAQIKQSTAIVSTNLMNNPRLLTGATTGNPYEKVNLVSLGPSLTYESKVRDTVGYPYEPKSFTQKVNESLTRKSSEQLLLEQMKSRLNSEQMMLSQAGLSRSGPASQTPMPQPRQQIPYQSSPNMMPQPRMVPFESAYNPQRNVQVQTPSVPNKSQIPWEQLPPQQIAQYDPQYAKYVAETSGSNTYRRGPYNKKRY